MSNRCAGPLLMVICRADGWTPDGSRRRQVVHGLEVDEIRYPVVGLNGPR